MPDPTPLSPAAQAVMEAYREASDGCYVNGEWIQDHAGQIAAAFRAAADQVDFDPWLQEHVDYHDKLLAIAAELEGSTFTRFYTLIT